MLYMVIERFKPDKKDAVYARYRREGRMLPDGLEYLSSWNEVDGDRCFQLMQADNPEFFIGWLEKWRDLVDFEVIPVTNSPTSD